MAVLVRRGAWVRQGLGALRDRKGGRVDPVGTLPALALRPVASSLTSPVQLAAPPGRPETLFIVEQGGTIRIHEGGQLFTTPFLDVTGLIRSAGEEGLLGLTFHPNYAQTGAFSFITARRGTARRR